MADAVGFQTVAASPHPEATRWQKISWVLYDWANSGYGLIVIGVPFADYFIDKLLPVQAALTAHADGSPSTGLAVGSVLIPASAVIGIMTSLSMALMALGAPVMGAIADIKGWTKRLLIIHTVAGAALAMAMFFLKPGHWGWAILLYVTSNYCFGAAMAFYNAFLPRLTRPEWQGSLSGWGFALGYVGGAVALIISGLFPLWFSDASVALRAGLAMAGAWWLLFSLPAFFALPEFPPLAARRDRGPLILAGFRRIGHTFRNIRGYRMLFLFLLAFLLYNDGIETVIALSPSFGKDVLGMSRAELIRMFLIVQGVAFLGAILFGYMADRTGNKAVIVINLLVWIVAGVLAFFVRTPMQFTLLGVMIGLVLGGVQASSRALMGLLAPREIHNEAFGFFSISGKFASILGPLAYSGLAMGFGPRYGIFAVVPFLVAGLGVLWLVKEPGRSDKISPLPDTTGREGHQKPPPNSHSA